jgi:hypothetical protein
MRWKHMVTATAAATVIFSALTLSPAHAATASVTCSGTGCDGKSPETTGCATGAGSYETAALSGTDPTTGIPISGLIELRYSPTCRTAWARIQVYDTYPTSTEAQIFRSSGGSESCYILSYSSSLGSYTCYTAMLYDGGVTSYAIGEVDNYLAYAQTGSY